MLIRLLTSFFIIVAFFGYGFALATQPQPPKIEITPNIKGKVLTFTLTNKEPFDVQMVLISGSLSSIKFKNSKATQLPSGTPVEIKTSITPLKAGLHALHVESTMKSEKTGDISGPSLYKIFKLDPKGESLSLSYEQAFLTNRLQVQEPSNSGSMDLGGGVLDNSKLSKLYFKTDRTPSRGNLTDYPYRTPDLLTRLPSRFIPKDFRVVAGEKKTLSEDAEFSLLNEATEADLEPLDYSASRATKTFRGRLHLKTTADSYHAAWGWSVRIWQKVSGVWTQQASTYVTGTGIWKAQSTTASSGEVFIEYRPLNRFVSLQDIAGQVYAWGESAKISGSTLNVGNRFVDASPLGQVPGLHKLYFGAMKLWLKFYSFAISAPLDNPIQVRFPNVLASQKCTFVNAGEPYAWSCTQWNDASIYMMPIHFNESAIQHEIAHSINSYYWNFSPPEGIGGSHRLWDCANPGLALTEGWANFISHWVQVARNAKSAVAPQIGMNLETLSPGVCNGAISEMRVAATLWDVYDSWNDGKDTALDSLLYANQGVPVYLYLSNKKGSISEYLPLMQRDQPEPIQTEFSKLFRLNKIIE